MKKLEIGDVLRRYVEGSGIWAYKVIGVRDYQDGTQYDIESQSCSHGWKCQLLVAPDDNGMLSYVHMTNNDDEDNQSYWHTGEFHFFTSLEEAKREGYEYHRNRLKDDLKKAESNVSCIKKRIEEIDDLISVGESK